MNDNGNHTEPATAAAGSCFELYQPVTAHAAVGDASGDFLRALPYRAAPAESMRLALQIAEGETVRAAVDVGTGRLAPAGFDARGVAAFRSVSRRLSRNLAMWDHARDAMVDGLPALQFALMGPKTLLVLPHGCVCYVTERVVPYVGAPTPAMIASRQKCGYCRLPVDETTRIVGHRCGAVYHHETVESHPDVVEKDRLNCLAQVGQCLCCRRPISLEPYLVWDPNTAEGPVR